jgi:hypothetical protein
MRKGFTREPKRDKPAAPVKNYITPSGLQRLKDEHRVLQQLLNFILADPIMLLCVEHRYQDIKMSQEIL